MSTLEAGMTRDEAFALLQEHNKDPFHIEHAETVEQTMRYFAREYDPDNVEFWGLVGLLVLVRTNRHWKQNVAIIVGLYAMGVFWGLIANALGIVF